MARRQFNVKRNFKFVDLIKMDNPQTVMREAGERLAVQLENRTLSGRDENNRAFKRYSPEYQRRAKFGRSTVDLHGAPTSAMWSDFGVVRAHRTGFALGFRSDKSALKAIWHEGGTTRGLPVRKFLGVPESWITSLKRWVVSKLPR